MKTALILAAGLGSRFEILTQKIPKGFLEILGKPLIEMSIENLFEKKYNNIIIVTGHQKFYYEQLAKKYKNVKTIFNELYNYSGSGYSLYLGLKEIEKGPVTVLESDLVYNKDILDNITTSANTIISSNVTDVKDAVFIEEYKGYMTNLSKNSSELKNSRQELVGISQLNEAGVNTIKKLKSNTIKNLEYEKVYINTKIRFALKQTSLFWCEIDNIEHYYRAVNKIFPFI